MPILNRALFYGEKRGNTDRVITVQEIEKAFDDNKEKLSPSTRFSLQEASQNFDGAITRNKTELYRAVTDELKKEFKVLDTVFEGKKVPEREMANLLRNITRDKRQDWEMVVRTELQNKKEEGFINSILQNKSMYSSKREQTRIFRRPNPDACKHCKKLYTTNGTIPRVFTIEEILKNGSNVGKKVSEWQPVIGATHPHCQCVWQVIPDNYEFDDLGNLTIKR
ncbi:hypothetical protein KQI68_06705 [Peptoniphilus sp. MSJ-1]|uniref:Phage head morphogenesis domain-containing protein n=1 Tax=Peptoniphilus ovalis TaxID=2841503 RepID=A0ABS6FHL5_9FIRM|nr:hypothetical protein [Peptoniphilus ovalis]MBU5669528.1 hypothetical protein [Peptoniphilus ovalis]